MRYLASCNYVSGEGVLCTETGIVLRRLRDRDILSLIARLSNKIPFSKNKSAIHIGALGEYDKIEETVIKAVGKKSCVACEDLAVYRLFSAYANGEEGITMQITPTFSAERLYEGTLYSVSPLKEGSLLQIAEKTISAATGAEGPSTILTPLLEEATGLPIEEAKEVAATLQGEKLAALGRLAAKGAALGDSIAKAIWEEALSAVSLHIKSLSRGEEMLPVKVMALPPFMEPYFSEDLARILGGKFSVSVLDAPIFLGGIKRAAQMLGLSPDEKFSKMFLETYKNFKI